MIYNSEGIDKFQNLVGHVFTKLLEAIRFCTFKKRFF